MIFQRGRNATPTHPVTEAPAAIKSNGCASDEVAALATAPPDAASPHEEAKAPALNGATEQGADLEGEAHKQGAELIIKNHVILVMGVSLVPIPLVDLVALVSVQIKMLHRLTQHYGIPFSEHRGKTLIASLLGGILPTSAAIGLASLVKAVPGMGTTTGVITISAIGGAATYAIGHVFAQHFARGGDLFDFDTRSSREYLATKFREGKGVVTQLRARSNDAASSQRAEP